MTLEKQIAAYMQSQSVAKRADMETLHQLILKLMPGCTLWFLNGKNSDNKTIANPNIGYGKHVIKHANGSTKLFYKIGMSANTTGISIYIMGIENKGYLAATFGNIIGKASISDYCIKFKSLKDINLEVLESVLRFGAKEELN